MAVEPEKASTRVVALESTVILVLSLLGAWMGFEGTATPDIDAPSGRSPEVVIVAPASPSNPEPASAEVRLWWLMDSRGSVRISAYGYDTADPNMPRAFRVLLTCGARLDDSFEAVLHPELQIEEFGDEAACGAAASEDGAIPAQQAITATGGRLYIEGTPRGTWTDVRGGHRLARTPSIGWFSSRAVDVDVAPTSIAEAGLTSELSETLDSVTPPEMASGDVLFSWGEGMLVDSVLQDPAVSWLTSACVRLSARDELDGCLAREAAEHPANPPDLRSGIARWTQVGGQQQAQWLTLGSGVALGIATTLAVEWILHRLSRRLRAKQSSSAM